MAHYAFLDKNNIVTEVIPGKDETETLDGLTPEEWYGQYRNQRCLRTSYNTFGNTHSQGKEPFRGNFAGIGYTYDETRDAFIPPQPGDDFTFEEETLQWVPNE